MKKALAFCFASLMGFSAFALDNGGQIGSATSDCKIKAEITPGKLDQGRFHKELLGHPGTIIYAQLTQNDGTADGKTVTADANGERATMLPCKETLVGYRVISLPWESLTSPNYRVRISVNDVVVREYITSMVENDSFGVVKILAGK